MKLFMRVFAECDSSAAANAIAADILAALSHLDVIISTEPKPYWKIAAYFDFTFIALQADQASLRKIVALCADGWVHSGDEHERTSVWNKESDASFLAPSVQWASVDLHA